ncbi:hypothetical protein [Burkholderia orbicola]
MSLARDTPAPTLRVSRSLLRHLHRASIGHMTDDGTRHLLDTHVPVR